MAEPETQKSKRDSYLERLRTKHPDKKFEDDEEIFGQISDDSDQYDQQMEAYKGRERKLSDMIGADPRSAKYLVDMANGKDPVVGLVSTFGIEIKDILDDPDKQEELAEANKQYMERVTKSKELDEEYEKNMEVTLETLRQFQSESGLSDEQIDEAVKFLLGIIHDGVMGKFSQETLDMALKAINHDTDVQAATDEGRVAGRNDKITEQLRTSQKGDGTQPIAGRNSTQASDTDGSSIFDLAAMAK